MEVFFAVTVLIAFILAWGWFCLGFLNVIEYDNFIDELMAYFAVSTIGVVTLILGFIAYGLLFGPIF